MKISSDTNGNRTLFLPVCSAVPYPPAPTRALPPPCPKRSFLKIVWNMYDGRSTNSGCLEGKVPVSPIGSVDKASLNKAVIIR